MREVGICDPDKCVTWAGFTFSQTVAATVSDTVRSLTIPNTWLD